MKTPENLLNTSDSLNILCEMARYNSGTNLLDSGGAYGRHHEKPPVNEEKPIVTFDNPQVTEDGEDAPWISATIETPLFLAEQCEHFHEMQQLYSEQENDGSTHFDDGRNFMEAIGYKQVARDNTHNGESDLSQCYVWEVYVLDGEDVSDWLYSDDAVLVVYIHTGCDVRGGYSPPVFLKSIGDYAMPVDLCAEIYVQRAWNSDGKEIDNEDIGEKWQCGYTSNPIYQFSEDVEKILEVVTPRQLKVKTTCGHVALVYVECRTY